ncbi:isochorismate synthase [Dysgonomonas sp. 25]|uniref:isochorismate synthase n=1 Tax=Dysgonomonas sp. 25 TaxID=2302933 RepID=UPI0013D2004A|nr:isochorismate synthase [Dysgonomonas sp. 25]NDV70341.1 isochorismate synthase [Dysgonomonas sp. 25]
MENNQPFDYHILDRLIAAQTNFAVYRLPGSDVLNLILQQSGDCSLLDNMGELTEATGFVLMPFNITASTPLAVIRPDIKLAGETDIFSFLDNSIKNLEVSGNNLSGDEIPSDNNTFEIYTENYLKFHDSICKGEFQKLVLSRSVNYNRNENFSIGVTFRKALAKYPNAFVYLAYTPATGTWFGCTPELLLSEHGDEGHTVALAGTMPFVEGEIEWDTKNHDEQQVVVNYVKHQLQSLGIDFVNSSTDTINAGNVVHLKTDFTFKNNGNYIGDILAALHPTPAVCGFPKAEAMDFIEHNESYKREYYSGFIGPLNIEGQSNIYVNLRCAKISPRYLALYAGGGIIESSDRVTEWLETESKLQTILSLIND